MIMMMNLLKTIRFEFGNESDSQLGSLEDEDQYKR